jgi:hypothetical protein
MACLSDFSVTLWLIEILHSCKGEFITKSYLSQVWHRRHCNEKALTSQKKFISWCLSKIWLHHTLLNLLLKKIHRSLTIPPTGTYKNITSHHISPWLSAHCTCLSQLMPHACPIASHTAPPTDISNQQSEISHPHLQHKCRAKVFMTSFPNAIASP